MPIRRELRSLYPSNWEEISYHVRFVRENGLCQSCGRPHGQEIKRLSDGRWFDPQINLWRDGKGQVTDWPDMWEFASARDTKVVLATAHLNHNPAVNDDINLASFCQRCHLIHDRPYHQAQARITYLERRAIGDLFDGSYDHTNLARVLQMVKAG